jgi:hypothetical protein
VDETARVLLTAAVLAGSGLAAFAWRTSGLDATQPDRLIAELRLAQASAVLLSAMAAVPIGLTIAAPVVAGGHLDAVAAVAFIVLAGFSLLQGPREALLLLSIGFVLHALVALAHRPGLLPPEVMPRWYAIASASYDLCLAAICFWARRR